MQVARRVFFSPGQTGHFWKTFLFKKPFVKRQQVFKKKLKNGNFIEIGGTKYAGGAHGQNEEHCQQVAGKDFANMAIKKVHMPSFAFLDLPMGISGHYAQRDSDDNNH